MEIAFIFHMLDTGSGGKALRCSYLKSMSYYSERTSRGTQCELEFSFRKNKLKKGYFG